MKQKEFNLNQFISTLKKAGVSKSRLIEYKRMAARFIRAKELGEVSSYEEFMDQLANSSTSGLGVWKRISLVKNIMNYDLHGKKPLILGLNKFDLLPPYYQSIVEKAVDYARFTEKSVRSQANIKEDGSMLMFHFYTLGIISLDHVTEKDVESFFFSDGEIKRNCSIRKGVAWFLSYCQKATNDPIYDKIKSYIPEIVNIRKIYPSLNEMETKCIEEVLLDESNALNWYDRAIGCLAFYLGIRACDIANLKCNNIFWSENKIKFVQSKTGQSITLVLDAVIGNPVFKYITKERPKVKIPFVFLRKKSHKNIDRHDIYKVTVKIFYLAGVRITGGRRGTHLLRHRLATNLVSNNTDLSIVSSALGHVTPSSTNTYLEADTKHMKECAISIEGIQPSFYITTCGFDIIKKLNEFISFCPFDLSPKENLTQTMSMGLKVDKPAISLYENQGYYNLLKKQSINSNILKINLEIWKN